MALTNRAARAALALAAATAPGTSEQPGVASSPNGPVVRVLFQTTLGDIEIAVYPYRAPISAGNFLT